MDEAEINAALVQSAAVWNAKDVGQQLSDLRRELVENGAPASPPVTDEGVKAWVAKVTKSQS